VHQKHLATRLRPYPVGQFTRHVPPILLNYVQCYYISRVGIAVAKCILATAICVSVCLFLTAFPHYCTDADVTWWNARRCPLVVHYWADLQSVDRFRCYDIVAPNAKCQQVLVLALCHHYHHHYHHHNRFMALFPGPPGCAGARRELRDFMVQGKINRDRHTDHPAGCHSIRTKQCPPPTSHMNETTDQQSVLSNFTIVID